MSKNLGPLFVSASFHRLIQLDPDTNRNFIVGTGSALGEIEFVAAITASSFVGDGSKLTNLNFSGSNFYSSSTQLVSSLLGQDLTVASLTAETLVISSSVTHLTQSYRSGSTVSGDTLDDTHQFTGSVFITGSLIGDGSGLTNLSTGSVHWNDVEQKPSGIVSSSTQVDALLAGTNIVSSSAQTGSVLGLGSTDSVRFGVLYATHSYLSGNLIVDGVITATEYVVSSSVYYVTQSFSSGSTIFGNSADDTHQFTGSVHIQGSITGSIATSSVTNFDQEVSRSVASFGFGQGSGASGSVHWNDVEQKPQNIVSSSAQTGSVLGLGPSDDVRFGNGTFDGNLTVFGNITAEEIVVSSSVYYVTQSFSSGSTIFGNSSDDTHQFTGSVHIQGSITGSIATSSVTNFDSEVRRVAGLNPHITGSLGDGSSTEFTLTHNFGTRTVSVEVWSNVDYREEDVAIQRVNNNDVIVSFTEAPATNEYSYSISSIQSSSNFNLSITTQSIVNFDSEVSRSVASSGFGGSSGFSDPRVQEYIFPSHSIVPSGDTVMLEIPILQSGTYKIETGIIMYVTTASFNGVFENYMEIIGGPSNLHSTTLRHPVSVANGIEVSTDGTTIWDSTTNIPVYDPTSSTWWNTGFAYQASAFEIPSGSHVRWYARATGATTGSIGVTSGSRVRVTRISDSNWVDY